MKIIIPIVGLLIGLFGFSQIIYPLFYSLPKIIKLKKGGKFVKPIPIHMILLAPIIWSLLIAGSILIVMNYFNNYYISYLIALGIMLIVVVIQIPKKNKDLENDFLNTWDNYLKK